MKKLLFISLLISACGTNGQNGTPGPQGPTGSLNVTVVQFCLGTPTYPSTFPETGLCIQGNIYAVYSANDGFLTEIVPGVYSSNALGSSCAFTVLPNCQIQN